MARIKIRQTIEIYEENDEDVPIGKEKSLGVESHWNCNERVILVFGRHRITVIGNDLITAAQNAMNSGRI